MPVHERTHDNRGHLGYQESVPYGIQPPEHREQVGYRQQEYQLAGDREQQAVHALPHCLERGAEGDRYAGQRKVQADDAQGLHADFHHLGRCVEHFQEQLWKQLEYEQPHRHDRQCYGCGDPDGSRDPLWIACPIVEGHDRDHGGDQSEHGHEYETLQLEIDPEDRNRGRAERDEDRVHADGHDRADRLHDDGGKSHLVDFTDDAALRPEALELELQLVGLAQHEEECQAHGEPLADYGGDRGSRDTHAGCSEQAEDQYRIEDDVDDRAQALGDHGVYHIAGALHDPFAYQLAEYAEGQGGADDQVRLPHGNDRRIGGEPLEEHRGEQCAEYAEDYPDGDCEEQPVHGDFRGLPVIPRPESA